ncbi:acyl-CoA carboxylase subunit epsilon [Streptomyces tendae]|uniref:acyl-CoA carboxylase subunit epsilon n=1 Tax=Streptomyces tendae TaxID=1932 RepID=UPI00248FB3E0|nr:acyl-CoA carboxylase subunit epsilon [Streptomyces tendae]
MGDGNVTQVIRVEKGRMEPEELAALTVILLTRAAGPAAGRDDDARRRSSARRSRRARVPMFACPRSWQR